MFRPSGYWPFPELVPIRIGFRLCSRHPVCALYLQIVSLLFLYIFSNEIFEFLFFDFVDLCLPPVVLHCYRAQPRKLTTLRTGIELAWMDLRSGCCPRFRPFATR